jgi:hypothetical protein
MAVVTGLSCGCLGQPLELAKKNADVIFRGKIIDLRPGLNPPLMYGLVRDTGKVVVFQVIRVWKGQVGPVFEMPGWEEAGACIGFRASVLKIGTELLVYAKLRPKSNDPPFSFFPDAYSTDICTRTALIERNRDVDELGEGYAPKK